MLSEQVRKSVSLASHKGKSMVRQLSASCCIPEQRKGAMHSLGVICCNNDRWHNHLWITLTDGISRRQSLQQIEISFHHVVVHFRLSVGPYRPLHASEITVARVFNYLSWHVLIQTVSSKFEDIQYVVKVIKWLSWNQRIPIDAAMQFKSSRGSLVVSSRSEVRVYYLWASIWLNNSRVLSC